MRSRIERQVRISWVLSASKYEFPVVIRCMAKIMYKIYIV
jgi:hypothetical protein